VELGKLLAKKILIELESADVRNAHDSSTRHLIDYYRANRLPGDGD